MKPPLMLATQSKEFGSTPVEVINLLRNDDDWNFELKWDGHRCMATKDAAGTVALTARSGADVTERYPDVVEVLGAVDGPFVLDGEVVAFNGEGIPDFDLLAKRKTTSVSKAKALVDRVPVSYVIFDVLELDGHNYRESPYTARQMVLKSMDLGAAQLSPSTPDGRVLWDDFVLGRGLEGLVAKHVHAPYRAGRQKTWIKLRRTISASFICTGYEPGTGWAKGLVGALMLEVYKDGKLTPVGKVGTGFTKQHRTDLLDLMGTNFVVEVEFQDITPEGLRFPSYRGLREDIDPSECTYEQLTQ